MSRQVKYKILSNKSSYMGLTIFGYREKPLKWKKVTVPQTNTSGLVENTKAFEKTMLKELGKTAVVTSG